MSLLEVEGLRVSFVSRQGVTEAVRGVDFHVDAGETLGIVGESGSGKSVSVLSLLGLLPSPPARVLAGRALFDGRDLLALAPRALRRVRGKEITMVFQDPMSSLNPYMRIDHQLCEPLRLHHGLSRRRALDRAVELLHEVGIPSPEKRLRAYPHQFSGGMRQRVMIAMAMITRPRLLIADEPTTALDVTVQRQILDLMRTLQREYGTAVIFITHDLGVIANISHRVAVMWRGEIVERGNVPELFHAPQHPYTQGLLHCLPSLHQPGERLMTLEEWMSRA